MKILVRIEYEKDSQVDRIYSDRGGEFIDSGFIEYFDYNSYQHEFSAPKTPQQNGISERENRTLQKWPVR